MSYFLKNRTRRTMPKAKGAMGDAFSDLWAAITGQPALPGASGPDVSNPTADNPGDESTSSSSTTQDTTVLPDGSTVGGQATGTPIASTALWKNVSGVCYATTSDFLSSLKSLQRQCNRVAVAKGLSPIAVDGQVGPQTLALLGKIVAMGAYTTLANPSIVTCDNVCSNVYSFIAATQNFADQIGASSSVSSPSPSQTPQIYDPVSGKLVNQAATASLLDTFANLSTSEKLLAGGAALGLVVFLHKESKKKGRR